MLITLPPIGDDDITESKPEPIRHTWEEYRRVQLWLNVAPWKCECKITNFGRNLTCARHGCGKPRPAHYTKTGGLNGHK